MNAEVVKPQGLRDWPSSTLNVGAELDGGRSTGFSIGMPVNQHQAICLQPIRALRGSAPPRSVRRRGDPLLASPPRRQQPLGEFASDGGLFLPMDIR